MLVETWRRAYLVLTVVLVFVRTMACVISTVGNLACGVGTNLDCDGVKTTTDNFGTSIIALGRLYSMLSYRPTSLEALSVPRG
jgi:hypothetical protein